MQSKVNVDMYNTHEGERVKVVAAVLVDPSTGLPTSSGGAGSTLDFELLVLVDANGVAGIRREIHKDGIITVEYENFMGGVWVPVQPVTLWSPALPPGAATSSGQAALLNSVGSPSDAIASSDGGSFTLIAFIKRLLNVHLVGLRSQLPSTLGGKAGTASLSVTPATDANLAKETYTVTTMSVNTSTSGATSVQFGSQVCTSLDVVNNSGVDVEVSRGATGVKLTIRDGTSRLMQGITNASDIRVRRLDLTNTPVSVTAEAFA